MNYTEIIQDICNELRKEIYREDRSDKSFKAKIVEKINDAKYKVLYCGNTYTVSSSIICEVGDMVRVCAPCNNWKDLFIVGSSSERREITDEYLLSLVNQNTNATNELNKSVELMNDRIDTLENIVYEPVPVEDINGLFTKLLGG